MSLHLSTPQTQCARQANCTIVLRGVIFVTTLSVFCRSLREKAYEIVITVKRTLNTRDVGNVAASFPHRLTMAPVVPDREQPLTNTLTSLLGIIYPWHRSPCASHWHSFVRQLSDSLPNWTTSWARPKKNLCMVCGRGMHTQVERLCLFHIFVFSVNIFKVIVKFYKYFNRGLNK